MIWVRGIAISIAVIAALAVAWHGQSALVGAPAAGTGFSYLLAGCAVAALLIELGRRWTPRPGWPEAPVIAEIAAVGTLIAVGCWLRITGFDQVPAGMNHDAAWNGIYANYIRSGEAVYTPYVASAWGRETLFMYMVAAAQRWFGGTAAAVSAAGIVAGVAAFIPMYLLIRALFGRLAGLAGFAFFAVGGWHWVYCRIGWRCVTVPPFEALALYFLWRALRRGGVLAWMGAGAFAAASIYTYNAARVVPIVIGGLAIWYVLLHRDALRWPLRTVVRDAVVSTLAFLAVGASMLWYAANNWVQFQGRAEHLLGDAESGVLANLLTALQMFNYRANGNDFFVAEPLLEPLAGVLFVLGAAILLLRIRSAAAQFTLLGLLLSLVPGLLSSPNGNRCITAMPFVYAMIGVGAAAAVRTLTAPFASRVAPWAAAVVLTAGLVQATVATYAQFVGEERRYLVGVSPEATAVGEYIGRFDENYRLYTVSDAWPDYTLQYLGYTHGNPLEPDIVIGRSLADVEKRISRYGRKGLVLVGDLTANGEAARRRMTQTFDESKVEPVLAERLGGREVARAVIVEPRSASRTAPWSNLTRVLEVSPSADGTGSGVRCFEPLVSAVGSFSARVRLMVPEVGGRAAAFSLATDCSTAATAITFSFASDGLVVDGPRRAVLVAASALQAGRWHDVGLVIDSVGNARATVDGTAVELGKWEARPRRVAGFIATVGPPGDAPALYVDDFAVVARALPADSPWWQTPPAPENEPLLWESCEGLPLGDLAGRPGWMDDGVAWRIRGGPAGPAGPGGAAVVPSNAFDGGTGNEPGKFNEPMGVGVDAAGNIYVCERMNHRVQKFAADGTYLGEWGVLGEQRGEFREPFDLAVEGDRVYVMDTWNTRLQVFDLTGNYLFQIGPDPILGKPRGIAVRDGKIYLANSGRDDILVYDQHGKLLAQFPPPETSTLRQIVDLVVDSQGRVYVNNSEQNRIEIFSPAGERIGAIEVAGWNTPHLKEFYMAIDDDDVIYVTDWDLHAVRRFRTDGTELPPVGPPMERPSGLAVHDGKVIVAARGENALRAFPLPPG